MTPTNPNSALSALKDIQLPSEIGIWPFAAGIWVLIFLALSALIVTAFFLVKRYKKKQQFYAPRNTAVRELNQIALDDPLYSTHISSLLKRTAISYGQRKAVAKLTGADWYQYLDDILPSDKQGQFEVLLANQYQAVLLSPTQANELKALSLLWLSLAPEYFSTKGGATC